MSAQILVVVALVILALACFFFAWRSDLDDTRLLNQLGRTYNCQRWPDESNNHYRQRLRDRIAIRRR